MSCEQDKGKAALIVAAFLGFHSVFAGLSVLSLFSLALAGGQTIAIRFFSDTLSTLFRLSKAAFLSSFCLLLGYFPRFSSSRLCVLVRHLSGPRTSHSTRFGVLFGLDSCKIFVSG